MPVSNTVRRVTYNGDGSTVTFAVPFRFLDGSHLKAVDGAGDELTISSVTGVGDEAGGSVTLSAAPATGTTVTILGNAPLDQQTDYEAGDGLPADVVEKSIDLLTIQNQEQAEKLARSVKFGEGDDTTDVTMATPVPGKALVVSDDGTVIKMSGANYDDVISSAQASATNAANSEAAAAASEANAATSEANAATSETNAAASAAAAAQSAIDAANHTHTLADITDSGALAGKDIVTQADIDPAVQLGGPSLGTNSIIRTNANTISEDITIPAGNNGMSAGPVSVGYLNELTWSDAFDNADWTKTGCTVWANAVASPTGTGGAADKLEEDSSTGFHYVYQNVPTTIGLPYTASVYVKPLQRTRVNLRFASGANVGLLKVNLNDGSLVSYSGSGDPDAGYVIEDAGGGWWRIAVTERAAATSTTVAIYMVDNAGSASYGGTNPEGLYLWGAQLTALPILTDPAPSTSVLPGATLTIADGATYTVV